MSEGSTWSRLQMLATTGAPEGGLGLFRVGSAEFRRVFGTAPPGIVDGRPESDLNFLRALRGREHILHLVCTRDLALRRLEADTQGAVLLLANHSGRAQRQVCAEVLHRALYLHWWVNAHGRISSTTSGP